MNKIISIFVLSLVIIGAILFFHSKAIVPSNIPSAEINNAEVKKIIEPKIISDFGAPLDRAKERVTKKPFGILINPRTSPVQPERFSGYHTGTDFEIFPEELEMDVSVRAVCNGKIRTKEYVNGYGGVVIQDCTLNNNLITVLYGHLKLASINFAIGDNLNVGDTIGILGKAYSQETNGERKHLHLSFHKGSVISVLGYVQNKKDLSNWIDPYLYVCK
jgi:hypothetical protein